MWQDALKQAANFNNPGFAGYTDWRMPNIKELSNLIDYSCLTGEQVGIDPTAFPQAAPDIWSNTPGATTLSNGAKDPLIPVYYNSAWMVYFNQGKLLNERIDDPANQHYVRLVRNAN